VDAGQGGGGWHRPPEVRPQSGDEAGNEAGNDAANDAGNDTAPPKVTNGEPKRRAAGAFPWVRRCRVRRTRDVSGWWVNCQCPRDVAHDPALRFAGTGATASEVSMHEADRFAREVKWLCP
jgi:hypothetical protein